MTDLITRLSKLDAPDIVAIFHEAVKKGWPDFTRRNASDFLRSYFGKEYRSISPERAKLVAQEYLDEYGVAADYPQEASNAE